MKNLRKKILEDLRLLGFKRPSSIPSKILDVAIIGAGQVGLGLCFALQKRGIFNVQLFDQADAGFEGPWATVARMKTLRTEKNVPDLALGIPHLSFRAYYEALGHNWESLEKIPTQMWIEYLRWYRQVLELPVKNNWSLNSINREKAHLRLCFDQGEVLAKKVVLATGRSGVGGFRIPSFVEKLPKKFWYHTGELIDPNQFQGKKVCILGNAASAFDIAANALENGAKDAVMLMRRSKLPDHNPLAEFTHWAAYATFSDEKKIQLISSARKSGTCPPTYSIERVKKWTNFELMPSTIIEKIDYNDEILILTNKGLLKTDFLLLATGYRVDISSVKELSCFSDKILLWKDRYPTMQENLSVYPYLGNHFEFLEKNPSDDPYLKDIYCFNYGALLSQGRISGDIDQLYIGVERIAEGILIDLI